MKPGPPVRILAAAGVLTLALVGVVVRENLARDQGQEVRLSLAGYDPRSLLQGHYVRFQLQETLPGALQCPPGVPRGMGMGKPGWVALRRDGDHHRPSGAAATREAALRFGEIAVRGRLDCSRFDTEVVSLPGEPEVRRESVTVQMDLGVDRIHLDQAQAEGVEADLQRAVPGASPGYAVLSVGRDGKARVKGLIVGARRVDLSWF